jgi:hypothetical protein
VVAVGLVRQQPPLGYGAKLSRRHSLSVIGLHRVPMPKSVGENFVAAAFTVGAAPLGQMCGGTGRTVSISISRQVWLSDWSKQCRPDPGGELDWVLKETKVIAGDLGYGQTVAFGKNHAGP